MSDKLAEIVDEINKRANEYEIGGLHEWRKKQGRRRGTTFLRPSKGKTWTMHYGGRLELQFNVGIEEDKNEFRYGVAFSFKPSRNAKFQKLKEGLEPRVRRFNEHLKNNPDLLNKTSCFYYREAKRKRIVLKDLIPDELIRKDVFIFFGETCKINNEINYDKILRTFDRLFPLYTACETKTPLAEGKHNKGEGFSFEPGYIETPPPGEINTPSRTVKTKEKHKVLKRRLYDKKVKYNDAKNVGAEIDSGNGQFIDLVVQKGSKYWFYEIKTQDNDRLCIREAIGQLLEYSYWPRCKVAERLIVAGEPKLTKDGKVYLEALREKLRIPVYYEQIT